MAKRLDTKFQRGKMKPEDEKCMRTYIADILEIEPRHIIDYLFADEIISLEDKQTINKKATRKDRADELFAILLDRGTNSFDGFIRALIKSRYLQLASKLKTLAEAMKYGRGQGARPTKIPVVAVVAIPKDKTKEQAIPRAKYKPSIVAQETNSDDTNPKRLVSSSVASVKCMESVVDVGRRELEDQVVADESVTSSRAPTEHDESLEQDTASGIYESLNTAYSDINNQVENFLPLLDRFKQADQDGQNPKIEEELKNELQKVKEEKKRLDQSPRQEQRVFNRDMVLLILQMNKVLSYMSGVLLKLAGSLKKSDTNSREIIDKMQNEIDGLKQQLEQKNEQLAELERDRCAERQGFMTDMRAALAEQRKHMLKDLHKEREAEKGKREKEESDRKAERELRERDKKERDEHKQKLEADKQKIEEDKLEMERLKQEMERIREDGGRAVGQDVEARETMNRGPGEYKEADRHGQRTPSRDVFTPRTHKTSLPVRGKAVQRQSRGGKN